MKKLITIIASALTLGAFAADQRNVPFAVDTTDYEPGTEIDIMVDGEYDGTIEATGGVIYYQANDYVIGQQVAFAPKMADGEEELIIAEGTLDNPTSVDLVGKNVIINEGCAAKFTAGSGNKVVKVTGSGANSYLILDGACGYGFADGSKISNLTLIIQDNTNPIWFEDRADPVFDESVNLIVKSTGKATFSSGQQTNPYVVFGSIATEEGAALVGREGITVLVAGSIDIGGATTTPNYMVKGVVWNNAINSWTDTTTSVGGTTITKDHTVVFDGFEKVLYNTCTTESNIRVVGGTMKIGHNSNDDNLKSGSVVSIGSGCRVELRCYDNVTSNTRSVNLPETIAFNGPGSVYVEEHINTVKIGSVTGNAQIDLGSSVANVTVSGTIANAISGAATVNAYTGMNFANTWTGTVKAGAIDNNSQKINLNIYGVVGSKVEFDSLVNYWLENTAAARTVNPEIVLKGHMLQNNMSQQTYVFKAISGTADALLEFGLKSGTYNPNSMTIETLKDFAGTIKNTMGKSVVISTLKTSLETTPESKTKVVNIAEGSTGGFTVTAATLADGTAIDSDKISVESDGIYVLGNTPAMPEDIADGSDDQKAAYVAWAAEVGITDPTVTGASEAFVLKLTAAELEAAQSVEKAVEDKLDTLITADMVAELAAKAAEGETTVTIEGFENATFTFVPFEEIETSAKLFRLSVSFKPENNEEE